MAQPDDDPTLGETTSNLSAANWGAEYRAPFVNQGPALGSPPAMAMLNGTQFWVYTYEPDAAITAIHDLYWQRCDATACTPTTRIPNQESLGPVSLAAYNGFIYMVHQGDSDETAVWFSRLDPSTNTWTPNVKLGFATHGGPPALAAFNGLLYMVGSQQVNNTYPLWFATMGVGETWAPSQPVYITNGKPEESATRSSLAVLNGVMYLAHEWGQTSEIVMQHMATTTWSAVQHIPAGPPNTNIQGGDVQLAVANGYLHLVHHRWSGDDVWWTSNRGCDAFAAEVTIPYINYQSPAMLVAVPGGLIAGTLEDDALWPYSEPELRSSFFLAPAAPIRPPNCSVGGTTGVGGGGTIGSTP